MQSLSLDPNCQPPMCLAKHDKKLLSQLGLSLEQDQKVVSHFQVYKQKV